MHIYRFSINLEGHDDFYLEIDILPSHTFLEFHNIIQSVMKFSGTELASFYMSNNTWKKKTEISLIDMNLDEDPDLYEDDDENKIKKKKNLVMSETKLGNIIADPHQRFIYIYDFLTPWTFYIELFKIIEADKGVMYPICSKITGELPTQKPSINLNKASGDLATDEIIIDENPEDYIEEEEGFDDIADEENELGDGFDELKF